MWYLFMRQNRRILEDLSQSFSLAQRDPLPNASLLFLSETFDNGSGFAGLEVPFVPQTRGELKMSGVEGELKFLRNGLEEVRLYMQV